MKRSSATWFVLASAVLLPASAFAACERTGDLVCGSGAPRLDSGAELQVSRGGNFKPLSPGAGLRAGDRVLTAATEARLSLGPSCTATVGPGSLVSLSRSGGRTCASVTSDSGAAGADGMPLTTGALGDEAGLPPAAIAAGAGAAGAAALAIGFSVSGDGRNLALTPAATVSAQ